MKLTKYAVAAILAAGMTLSAHALTITLPGISGFQRTASLTDASVGYYGTGNGRVQEVEGYLGGDWTERGSVAPANNSGLGTFSDGLLTVMVTSGTFGNSPVAGTWTINSASFWTTYADAAISMHAGNGGGNPDHFVWLITDGMLSGTWSYAVLSGTGGGLSNLKLYSRGTGTSVPDGSSTIALLGSALVGVGALRHKLFKA